MDAMPQTQYARLGEEYIAYQVFGEGPDIMFVRTAWNHVELQWEEPRFARFLRRLASFGRVMVFDPRGTGLSDAFPGGVMPTLEDWVDDILAVMDAASSDQAVVVANGVATSRAVLHTAAHPHRVSSLVICDGFARLMRADDYPWGPTQEEQDLARAQIPEVYGRVPREDLMEHDPALAEWFLKYQRHSVPPGFATKIYTHWSPALDLREVLPSIRVPTLVIQHEGQLRFGPVGREPGRYLAERIAGSKYVELPGVLLFDWRFPDPDAVAAEIEHFVLGTQTPPEPDRVLATILFTDIVDSTRSAVEVGDRRWRDRLDALDRLVDQETRRFRGRVVKSTGDGHVATFDGPGRAIRCATTLSKRSADLGLPIRAGLHTGEVEVRGDDITGIAVNIARRVCDAASEGLVFVSPSVPPLVAGSEIAFADRGSRELKGVPGDWNLYEVIS